MSESTTLRAVVFDLDGLIANTEDLYLQAGQEVLLRRGKTYDLVLREQMMGRPAAEALRILIDHHALEATVDELAAETQEMLAELMASGLEPMPGLLPLLNALTAAEFPLAVATSATRPYAENVLAQMRLADRFEALLTAEDIEHGKPAPDVYQLAAERLNLRPEQTMVLEDSGNGCQAGVAAGAFTVAVPNDHTRDHNFSGVQFIADTLADPRIREALRLADC